MPHMPTVPIRLIACLLAACCITAVGGDGTRPAADRLVGAYYYPWYYTERWTREPVANTPRLGWYSSDDRSVADQHIRWARQADIDFFLVSWLSAEGREGTNLADTLLPAIDAAGFRFAVLYETPLALGTPAGKPIDLAAADASGRSAGDRMVAHFDQLADAFLAHPRYLRLAGRPVVVIYLVRDMVNAGPTLTSIRARLAGRGIDLHLIADMVYWETPDRWEWKFLAEHFQGLTAYNMYYRPDFLRTVRTQFEAVDRAGRPHGIRLVPSVMPGYDDTPLRGTERVTINRRRGDFYREFFATATPFVDAEQPLLLVTSFNEWHEGTELEPSEEYGEKYLNLTRELVAPLRGRQATGAVTPPTP
jgi:hypothetical protein